MEGRVLVNEEYEDVYFVVGGLSIDGETRCLFYNRKTILREELSKW